MDLQLSWFFGICVTGFLFLTGWIIQISLKVSMVNEIKQDVCDINNKVDSIHLSLVGNMDKEGLISTWPFLNPRRLCLCKHPLTLHCFSSKSVKYDDCKCSLATIRFFHFYNRCNIQNLLEIRLLFI